MHLRGPARRTFHRDARVTRQNGKRDTINRFFDKTIPSKASVQYKTPRKTILFLFFMPIVNGKQFKKYCKQNKRRKK